MKTDINFCSYVAQSSYNEKSFRKKSCRESQNTHFVLNDFFLNRAIYEMMWKNIVESG